MRTIELRNGPKLPEAAVLCALEIEAAGHTLTARDGKLSVTNSSTLTDAQRKALKAHHGDIVKLLDYVPPEPL